jgi:tetratricopeptide (TPR) repeat protein
MIGEKMDLSLILTILFGIVSIIAFLYAIRESKKAKRAEKRIIEIENAVVSYKYLKQKAYEYYNNGRYEESLDVFKKYFLGNKDEQDWTEVILDIYKKETEKIYSKVITLKERFSATVLIMTYIMYEKEFSGAPQYPNLLRELIKDYKENFGKDLIPVNTLIAIFDKNWKSMIDMISKVSPYSDKEMNDTYQKLLKRYFTLKLPQTGDDFTDDVPF